MNAKERFDSIVTQIEQMISSKECLKATEVKEAIAKQNGLGIRDMNTVFVFLTGLSLLDYIRERQMMAAYDIIVNQSDFCVERAIIISGYDNQSSFCKKFKETFGMSPGIAFKKKDKTKLVEPLTWEAISNGERIMNKRFEQAKLQKMIYGLPESQYKKLQKILDLQALYEFSDEQSNLAYYISEQDHLTLRKVFSIMAEYLDWEGDLLVPDDDMEKAREITGLTTKFIYVYEHVTRNIRDAKELIKNVEAYGYDSATISAELLKYYLRNTSFSFSEFMHLADVYGMNTKRDIFDDDCKPFEVGYDYEPEEQNPNGLEEDDFMAYLDRVRDGESPEEALYEEDYSDY